MAAARALRASSSIAASASASASAPASASASASASAASPASLRPPPANLSFLLHLLHGHRRPLPRFRPSLFPLLPAGRRRGGSACDGGCRRHRPLLLPPARFSPAAAPSLAIAAASFHSFSPLRSATAPPPPAPEEPVLLSSKECANGDILFTFGDPRQHTQAGPEESVEESEGVTDICADKENEENEELAADSSSSDSGSPQDTKTLDLVKDINLEFEQNDSAPEDCAVKPDKEEEIKHALTGDLESEKSSESVDEKNNQVLKLYSGGAIRPHPDKVSSGGEDAYFIEGMWAGVADGVGGWALSGVDSGIYSRELMKNCGHFVSLEKGIPDPRSIIIKSVAKTKAMGTCTATVASLHRQTLYVANVGDSGFLVVRDGDVIAKSKPMQRGFNFPYQIGSDGDDPSMAETFEVGVESGDVLVLATDGVYDNLYEREIVDVIVSGHSKGVEPNIVATWLVKLAHQAGLNNRGRSPFSDAAQAAGYACEGGKLDDATVVVSYIK